MTYTLDGYDDEYTIAYNSRASRPPAVPAGPGAPLDSDYDETEVRLTDQSERQSVAELEDKLADARRREQALEEENRRRVAARAAERAGALDALASDVTTLEEQLADALQTKPEARPPYQARVSARAFLHGGAYPLGSPDPTLHALAELHFGVCRLVATVDQLSGTDTAALADRIDTLEIGVWAAICDRAHAVASPLSAPAASHGTGTPTT